MGRYNRWERDQVLSFIPPDGRFQLLDYQTAVPPNQKPPLHVKAAMSTDEYGGESWLNLPNPHRPTHDFRLDRHVLISQANSR